MAVEPLSVQLARMDEKLKMILDEQVEARAGRKEQYTKLANFQQCLSTMGNELTMVKDKLAGQAPTIEEFITIKHKVVGAGAMGKFLWTIGAFLVGIAFSFREAIGAWLKI